MARQTKRNCVSRPARCALPVTVPTPKMGRTRPPSRSTPTTSPAARETSASQEQQNQRGSEQDFWTRDKMTGEWGGLRKTLEQNGVTINLSYQGEMLANLGGGIKRGTAYEHEILGEVDVDLEKLLHWSGATFHVSAYDYAGGGLTKGFVGSLATVSSIEAPPSSVRLFTLW